MTATKTKTRAKASSPAADRTKAYAEDVVAGRIVAGPHVRNACRRHLLDLQKGGERGLYFDLAAADYAHRFFEQILKLSEGQFDGKDFNLHPSQAFIVGSLFGWKQADGTRRFRRAYIEQGKGNGKALALDTPIPTPTGWTTMGALRDGDAVLDDAGNPCQVLRAHPVSDDQACYRVEFDDGEVIVASGEHLWRTEMRSATKAGQRRATRGVPKAQWGAWRNGLRTTAEMAETLRYANGKYQSANHSIALCGPLALPAAELPIEPYALGAWLGDGDSDCARITIGDKDAADTISALTAAGWEVSGKEGSKRYRVAGLQAQLRAAGLLNNKHIPSTYMRASTGQRLALLQGLMDTDGCISPAGQCEFTQVKRVLAEQVLELALSLGLKATMLTGIATIGGREIGPKYRVIFHPREDQPCFRLPRKLARQATRHSRRRLSADRKIVGCERVPSVPVRCITVDSPRSMFLAGRSMVPTHNSPLAGGLGLLGMTADREPGAQVYSAAAKKDQAGILFADAVKMVKQSPLLAKRITFAGGEGREFNMAHHASGSFFRPVSRDTGRTGSGPRPYFVLVDEVHELPDRKIIEMLERGFKFRRQPLLFMITNSGSDRTSVCWEEHEHAVKVAAGHTEAVNDPTFVGDVIDDRTFSYVCALDEARTEFYEFEIALRRIVESCTCNAKITLTDLPSPQDFAALVTRSSGGPTTSQRGLAVPITPTVRLFLDAFATLATRDGEKRTIRRGESNDAPTCGTTPRASGLKSSPESATANIESAKQLPTQLGRSTGQDLQSTASRRSKSQGSSQRRVAGAGSAEPLRSLSGWITATLRAMFGDCSAIPAMQESVCSEITSRLYNAHSNTCETRQRFRLQSGQLAADLPADDPLIDPSCWVKANPLLGVTITDEYLRDVVNQGKQIPGSLNGILRLHFCVWTDAETAWMTRATLEPALADFDPAEHHGKRLFGGLDLSQSRDLTAAGFVVETGSVEVSINVDGEARTVQKPTYDAWVEVWTPGDTVQARQLRDKLPYDVWIRQGHLHAPAGQTISFRHVAQTLAEYQQDFDLALVAYDRYAFRKFEDEVHELGLSIQFAEHPQGGLKKGKPLEAAVKAAEMDGRPAPEGMWMPGSVKLFEEALLEGRIRIRRNPVLVSALMSAVSEEDKWGNHWLSKLRSVNKIDPAVALVMAIGAANALGEESTGMDEYLEHGFFGLIG